MTLISRKLFPDFFQISQFWGVTQGIFRKLFPKNFFPLSHAPQNLEKVWEKFPGYPLGYRPFFGNSFRDLPMWVKNHFSRSYSLFFLGPSTFGFQDRPLSQTVHFKSFGPSSLAHDRPVSVVWTVRFNPPGPSTLDLPLFMVLGSKEQNTDFFQNFDPIGHLSSK